MGMDDLRRQGRERGTTLVEVMITLAVVATLVSAFGASVRSLAPAYRWQQGTQAVVETLREARQFAIAKNATVDVQLTVDQLTVIDRSNGDAEILVAALPQGVTLDGLPAGGDTVTFTPRSTCNGPASIKVLGHDASVPRDITLVKATGRVLAK